MLLAVRSASDGKTAEKWCVFSPPAGSGVEKKTWSRSQQSHEAAGERMTFIVSIEKK